MFHLEKKLRWPADEVSPSYESLCLRLSDGPLWLSLGAEISMLLLLSLLLELRPGLDSPSRPVLSWSKGGGREYNLLHNLQSRLEMAQNERSLCVFLRWAVACGRQKMCLLEMSGSEWQRGGGENGNIFSGRKWHKIKVNKWYNEWCTCTLMNSNKWGSGSLRCPSESPQKILSEPQIYTNFICGFCFIYLCLRLASKILPLENCDIAIKQFMEEKLAQIEPVWGQFYVWESLFVQSKQKVLPRTLPPECTFSLLQKLSPLMNTMHNENLQSHSFEVIF